MRLLKMTVGMGLAVFAMMAITAAKVDAATLTFIHSFGGTLTTYELVLQEGCTNDCAVTLTIDYSDPSAFDGKYLDSVQFMVDGNAPSDPHVTSAPGGAGNWVPSIGNLNANQCGNGNTPAVCAEFNTALGVPVAAGDSLVFTFTVDWTVPVTDTDSGNVRAAYNNADGSNFTIFSPGGGNFGGDGGEGGGILVPEPASLSLFGLALFGAACRARRRRIG